jgi:hypothetical protein
MTSGSFSQGSPGNLQEHRYKTWTGTNGKYEIVNGKKRIKWNNYSMFSYGEYQQYGGLPVVTGQSGTILSWSAADDFRLQSKLVERIKGHEFNLAVNLAQSRQLVDMCVGNIRKFSRSLHDLKRGNIAGAMRELGIRDRPPRLKSKDVSGRWLELQYGWLPAVSDSYEAAKAFELQTKMRSTRVSATAGKTGLIERSASPTNYSFPGVHTIRKRVEYEMTEQLSLSRSLGLMDPLSVVWEIIPWSFVIDWFLPVGSYLENLAVIPFLNGRFITTKYEEIPARYAYGKASFAGKMRTSYERRVDRVVSSGLNTQRPSFNSPAVALSAKRIFNAVALAHQRLS